MVKIPGDKVIADEPVVELETDKVNVEVPAPTNGILGNIAVKEEKQLMLDHCLVQLIIFQVKEKIILMK